MNNKLINFLTNLTTSPIEINLEEETVEEYKERLCLNLIEIIIENIDKIGSKLNLDLIYPILNIISKKNGLDNFFQDYINMLPVLIEIKNNISILSSNVENRFSMLKMLNTLALKMTDKRIQLSLYSIIYEYMTDNDMLLYDKNFCKEIIDKIISLQNQNKNLILYQLIQRILYNI